jgi:16S rRNA (guanine1207-N2)-methyltransferase
MGDDMAEKKDLQLPSQLLMRHTDLLVGKQVLVVGYPADGFLLRLSQNLPGSEVTAFGFDYAVHRYQLGVHRSAGLSVKDIHFGPFYASPEARHDLAIVFLPKSRPLVDLTLRMTAGVVQPGSRVLWVGENRAGIRSSRALLERIIGPTLEVEAARHCVLYQARSQVPSPVRLDDWQVRYPIEVNGHNLTVVGYPGVFSQGRLDDGTRFLLENMKLPARATVLDFGCGAGVIGALVKQVYPGVEVDLVDSNALALAAARSTMAVNGLQSRDIRASDVFSDVQGMYTHILSNLPFHTGVATDYRVAAAFFEQAAQHLFVHGSLYVVANRFLKYAGMIEAFFGECRVIAHNQRYNVYAGTYVR